MGNHTSKNQINRLNRIVLLGVSMFTVLVSSYIGASWMLYQEITHIYMDHYNSLIEIGITNAITSPEVVGERVLMLISLFPLAGVCLAAPLLYLTVREVISLSNEKQTAIKETMHLIDGIEENDPGLVKEAPKAKIIELR